MPHVPCHPWYSGQWWSHHFCYVKYHHCTSVHSMGDWCLLSEGGALAPPSGQLVTGGGGVLRPILLTCNQRTAGISGSAGLGVEGPSLLVRSPAGSLRGTPSSACPLLPGNAAFRGCTCTPCISPLVHGTHSLTFSFSVQGMSATAMNFFLSHLLCRLSVEYSDLEWSWVGLTYLVRRYLPGEMNLATCTVWWFVSSWILMEEFYKLVSVLCWLSGSTPWYIMLK